MSTMGVVYGWLAARADSETSFMAILGVLVTPRGVTAIMM
jgi:hypothetical protein